MVDISLRRNEKCVIQMPHCGYAFSSTKRVFIAYGFNTSPMEKDILRNIISEHGLDPIEAAGSRVPGAHAFCVKICSQIITSRFCVVLVNDDLVNGALQPNANVNMEYGLMLGFNKYVIPFQRSDHKLSFNISGLDTIKYRDSDFSSLAKDAIAQAVRETEPKVEIGPERSRVEALFLMKRDLMPNLPASADDKGLELLATHFDMSMYMSADGMTGTAVGNFSNMDPLEISLRCRKFSEIFEKRSSPTVLQSRVQMGLMTAQQAKNFVLLKDKISLLVIVSNNADKENLIKSLSSPKMFLSIEVVTLAEMESFVS